MNISKMYLRINWWTLIFIYLVIIAGSFVRVSGSGMGCPDWPKCFGQVIPPTSDKNLPANYKDIYSQKREKKIIKFAGFLEKIGFTKEANQLRNDKTLLIEQEFNARKTWTEYINRLFGVLAGFGVLFVFVGALFKYRKRSLIVLSMINLIVLVVQAWFGSIVVATNLVPWTITIHLLLALVIVAVQIGIIYVLKKENGLVNFEIPKTMKYIIWVAFVITFYQLFLGTQVREYIDELSKQGFDRETWTGKLGMSFFIHRSFSWLVLIILSYLAWWNYNNQGIQVISLSFVVLAIELISGILLVYTNMPGLVQTVHLLLACVLFGALFYAILKLDKSKM